MRVSHAERERRRRVAADDSLSRSEQAAACGLSRAAWDKWLQRYRLGRDRDMRDGHRELYAAKLRRGTLYLRVMDDAGRSEIVRLGRNVLRALDVRAGDRVRVSYDGIGRRLIVEAVRSSGRAAA